MMKKLVRITTVPLSLDKLLGKQLSFMNQFFEVTAVSADQPYLKRVAEKYGVNHFHVEMSRQITPVQDLKSLWKMYRFLKKEKPDIVHTHTPKAGLIGMLAARFAGVKIRLHTVAGMPLLEATGSKRKILNQVEKLTYSMATKIYPNSNGLRQIIEENQFCDSKKLKVIANGSSSGIDIGHFNPEQISQQQKVTLKKQLGISETDFVFVFVGRLVKDKGINELVHGFKKINQQLTTNNQQPKLLLVGPLEEDLDPLLPETLEKIKKNKDIISVGFQDDVRPYFAISDALIFPSYREGFPNVVLQAGAMGLPSIVTNINGCNEIISQEVNGLIIEPKNSKEIEEALLKISTNSDLYEKLKKNTRQIITERYDQNVILQELLKEYESLTNT